MTQYEGSMSRSFMLEKDWVRVRVAREQRKVSSICVDSADKNKAIE